MTQAIVSVFISFLLIEELNLSFRLSVNVAKRLGRWRLFKCLPCFTFWTSLTVGACSWIWFNSTITEVIINSMLAFIVAVFLDCRNK